MGVAGSAAHHSIVLQYASLGNLARQFHRLVPKAGSVAAVSILTKLHTKQALTQRLRPAVTSPASLGRLCTG